MIREINNYEGDAETLIRSTLDEVERKENVRILRAVESGSRAWGFASPDSDYDVRFIYIRPLQSYLTLRPRRPDTIEWVVDETLDVVGWDLSKALQLAHKGNAFLFEWGGSPIVYRSTPAWDEIWQTAQRYFSSKAALHSYYGIARKQEQLFLQGEGVRYKKYLYVLRPLLACTYMLEHGEQPPVAFSKLVDAAAPRDLVPAIEQLLVAKAQMREKDEGPHIDEIDTLIRTSLERYQDAAAGLDDEQRPWEPLEACFWKELGVGER